MDSFNNENTTSGVLTTQELNQNEFYIDSFGQLNINQSIVNKINNSVSQSSVRVNESNIKTTNENNQQFNDKVVFYFDLSTNQWKYKELGLEDFNYSGSLSDDSIIICQGSNFCVERYVENNQLQDETINESKISNLLEDETTQNLDISNLETDVNLIKNKFEINENNNYIDSDLIVNKITNSANNHVTQDNSEYVTFYNLKTFLELFNVNGIDVNNFELEDFTSELDILTQIVNGLNANSAQIIIDTTNIQNKLNSVNNLFDSSENEESAYKLINNNKQIQEYLLNEQIEDNSVQISKIENLETELDLITVLENVYDNNQYFLMSDKTKQEYILDSNIQLETIAPNKIENFSESLIDEITTNENNIVGITLESNFLNSLKNNYDVSKTDYFLCQDSTFKQITFPELLFSNITDKLENLNINDDSILISKIKDLSKYISFFEIVSLNNLNLQNEITCNELFSNSLTQTTIDPSEYVTYYQLQESESNLSSIKPSNCLFYNSPSTKNIIVYDTANSDKFYYQEYLDNSFLQDNTINGIKFLQNTVNYDKLKTSNSAVNGYVLSYDSSTSLLKWIENTASVGSMNFYSISNFPNLPMNGETELSIEYTNTSYADFQVNNNYDVSNVEKTCRLKFETNQYNSTNKELYQIFCYNDSSNYQYMETILGSTVHQELSNYPYFVANSDNSYRNEGLKITYGMECDALIINSPTFYENMAITKNYADNNYMSKSESLTIADNSINYMKLVRSVPSYEPEQNELIYIRDFTNGLPNLGTYQCSYWMFDPADDGTVNKNSNYCRTFYNYYSPYTEFSTGQWGEFIENQEAANSGYRTGMELGFEYTTFYNYNYVFYFGKSNGNTNLWGSGYYFYLSNGSIYNSCVKEGKEDLIEKTCDEKDYIEKLMNLKLYTYRTKQIEEFNYDKEFEDIKKYKENKDKSDQEIKKIVDEKEKIDLHEKYEIHENFVYDEVDDSLKNINKYYKCKKDCNDENCKECFKCPYENCDICERKDKCVNQTILSEYLLLGFEEHVNEYEKKIEDLESRLAKLESLLLK